MSTFPDKLSVIGIRRPLKKRFEYDEAACYLPNIFIAWKQMWDLNPLLQ